MMDPCPIFFLKLETYNLPYQAVSVLQHFVVSMW